MYRIQTAETAHEEDRLCAILHISWQCLIAVQENNLQVYHHHHRRHHRRYHRNHSHRHRRRRRRRWHRVLRHRSCRHRHQLRHAHQQSNRIMCGSSMRVFNVVHASNGHGCISPPYSCRVLQHAAHHFAKASKQDPSS